jgi:cell division protein ZapB
MASDFQNLSEKITQLAELTQQLRRENAELRRHVVTLKSENADVNKRMLEARARVAAMLERYPAPATEEEES